MKLNSYVHTHGGDADFVGTQPFDVFGRQFLELRHDLRSMIEQAELGELESAVRVLIRSGFFHAEEIVYDIVSLVGEHVENRIQAVIEGGEGHLWITQADGCLRVVEACHVR